MKEMTLKITTPKTNGVFYGITRPRKYYQWTLADTFLTMITLGFWMTIKFELDESKWRRNNKKSDKKLRDAYGQNYWRIGG